ncbi:AAA family ATPase [Anatilimnocola floriformis]|uniref:AAA family ATPase n=1 Tax=Anatilimnocola floriformis TaxID=2948575 RepID=UPI0020C1EB4F|nr:AAA family ATPase [Anatilimnocola floriformis]
MTQASFDELAKAFAQALHACRELYVSGAHQCVEQCPHLIAGEPEAYVELLDNLHRGLLVKVFAAVATSDRVCSVEEQRLAATLLTHAYGEPITPQRVRETLPEVLKHASTLSWYSLLRPFDVMPPLQLRVAELESVVMQVANLTAKIDGYVSVDEEAILRTIQGEIDRHLKLLPIDEPTTQYATASIPEPKARAIIEKKAPEKPIIVSATPANAKSPQEMIADALKELEQLTGLQSIKAEVRTLVNVLQLQRQRQELGLPQTPLSLHLVFRGNPGTGKTTVARIIGRIYAALGLLQKGHLVEVDRSALVAEFAGQTGPKTNKKIDEALGGLLFVDEAYSLVADGREDPYGNEAVQAILKRMEDDRHRLAIIFAGYPEPLDQLLTSNPGLSSRFNTQLTFADYTPGELGQIFKSLCEQNHYHVTGDGQGRLLLVLAWLHEQRDEHFGNGRLVRNIFEQSIRRLANRIAGIAPLTKELLTTFEVDDIALHGTPETAVAIDQKKPARVVQSCPECKSAVKAPLNFLGKQVRCPKCQATFTAEWGELETP